VRAPPPPSSTYSNNLSHGRRHIILLGVLSHLTVELGCLLRRSLRKRWSNSQPPTISIMVEVSCEPRLGTSTVVATRERSPLPPGPFFLNGFHRSEFSAKLVSKLVSNFLQSESPGCGFIVLFCRSGCSKAGCTPRNSHGPLFKSIPR